MKDECLKGCFCSKAAFTLVELLVVVLIIGILTAIALPKYQSAVDKSRYSHLMTITQSLAQANEVYYLTNGEYATSLSALDVVFSNQNSKDITCRLVGQQEVQCANYTTLKNEYIIQYKHSNRPDYVDQRVCSAITEEEGSRFDKVCAALGTFKRKDWCTGGRCRTYIIKP